MRGDRRLTPRQTEITLLMAKGHGTNQIAAELFISLATVRNHIQSIMEHYGAHSRLQAVSRFRADQDTDDPARHLLRLGAQDGMAISADEADGVRDAFVPETVAPIIPVQRSGFTLSNTTDHHGTGNR